MPHEQTNEEMSKRLRKAREAADLTQVEVAKLIDKSSTTITNYESGFRKPPMQILKQLSELYGVTFSYLAGFEEPTENEKDLFENDIPEILRENGVSFMRVAKQFDLTPEEALSILEAVSKVKKGSR